MTTLLSNTTLTEEISSYDLNGAIIYIFGVLIWYAIGFGLILIDDINPQVGGRATYNHTSVYQTVTDLHEQQARNDILVELKDKDRRAKLWQIYYGTKKSHPTMVQKDAEAVELINKQLNELKEQRRDLQHSINEISFDLDDGDAEHHHDEIDHQMYFDSNSTDYRRSRSMEHFKNYFK